MNYPISSLLEVFMNTWTPSNDPGSLDRELSSFLDELNVPTAEHHGIIEEMHKLNEQQLGFDVTE